MSNWLDLVWICISVEVTPNRVIRFGETCFLVSWCVGGECDMADSDENRGRSRRLGAEDWRWSGTSRVLNRWMIGRSGDTMCNLHHTRRWDEKREVFDLASKPVAMVCWWYGHKTTVMVSWFGPQNQGRWFGDLGLKITVTISWFGPQNQVRGGLSVCASKLMSGWRRCEDTRQHPVTCFIMKQVGLGFPSFASKLVKERQRVVHVASSWRLHESEGKDDRFDGVGCDAVEVGPNYPSLDVIFLLAHRGILVFFCYKYTHPFPRL
jgi:hypothetical protein